MGKKNSFVKQASFLMVAGLLVRVIGLLYRPVMKANIGDMLTMGMPTPYILFCC